MCVNLSSSKVQLKLFASEVIMCSDLEHTDLTKNCASPSGEMCVSVMPVSLAGFASDPTFGVHVLRLKLFYKGEVSQYRRSRDIESLKDFVSTILKNHERRKEVEEKKEKEREEKEQEKQQIRDEVKRQEEEEEVSVDEEQTSVVWILSYPIPLQIPAPVVDDSGIVHLTEKNFMNYLVNHPGVHFVKFYAPWCVNVCMSVSM